MNVYDCFIYNNEDLILDIRLNHLDKFVKKFIIVEARFTHQGKEKKTFLDLQKFQKFKDKIIHLFIENFPSNSSNWERENFQRNYITNGLVEVLDEDYVLISDLDEIPNIKKFNYNNKFKYTAFEQKNFSYKLNLLNTTYPSWYGTKGCKKKYLKSPQWLRDLKFKKRPFWRLDKIRLNNIIKNGGWHFCNLKTPENLLYKYKNLCETNDPIHFNESIDSKYLQLDEIRKKITSGEDIIGRKDSFIKVNLDSSFPEYLTKNRDIYKDWII